VSYKKEREKEKSSIKSAHEKQRYFHHRFTQSTYLLNLPFKQHILGIVNGITYEEKITIR
jgi:hypothetical protein